MIESMFAKPADMLSLDFRNSKKEDSLVRKHLVQCSISQNVKWDILDAFCGVEN